jgi:adenine deaminase
MLPKLTELQFAVDVAMGRKPGTLLLKNARLANVFSLEIQETHILLAGSLVAGVSKDFAQAQADEVLDLNGHYVVPGLIDGHLHIESSMVAPAEYASAVVPRGVTGCVADPHEIGNVSGVPGIEWMLQASENLPLEVWLAVPSSVPSTPLETSGAELNLRSIERVLQHPRVAGVAELMSFPAILAADPTELSKVLLAEEARKLPEGHAPTLMGRTLQAYLASGINSDHESTVLQEGREKLESGCYLMIREGSVTRDLEALVSLLQPRFGDRVGLVTDDRLPHDLLEEGGVDFLVRKAIALGADPIYTIRAASLNTALHYRLNRRGAVAAGYQADFSIMDDLAKFKPSAVYQRGKKVAEFAQVLGGLHGYTLSDAVRDTVRLPELSPESLQIAASEQARAIRPVPGGVLTQEVLIKPTVQDGQAVADPSRDLAKLVCFERHGRKGGIGVGLVTGFGIRAGAMAGTVAHDHHNLLAVGISDSDIVVAAKRLEQLGGGLVAVKDGQVLAELPLPIAGLLSDQPLHRVREMLDALHRASSSLGVNIPDPYMVLSFLGLAVIPELRLTDKGLVDVRKGELVPLAVG